MDWTKDDRDNFDIVAEYIFQRSDAKSVLLHHHDIQTFLQEDEGQLTRTLTESGAAERVEIDENGVGRLLSPVETRFPGQVWSDSEIDDDTCLQVLPTQASAMAAKTQKLEGRDAAFSSLNAAVEALNLAKEITGFAQAKAVFGSVGLLLTLIRDSMINERDYVELGLSCADICGAFDRGTNGKKPDDLSQSVYEATNQLTITVEEIQRKVVKQSKRKAISRDIHVKSDRETIAAWKLDLDRIFRVFNAELGLDTHATIFGIRHGVSKIREKVGGQVHSTQNRSAVLTMKESDNRHWVPGRPGESPPLPPRTFFGRNELIDKIVGFAENLTPVALIGPGGIGKTSVALAVLHHDRIKRRFGENRRFVRCDQLPASRTSFLNGLSKAIGASVENPEDMIPLLPYLSSREMIIVLDNAESILDPRGTNAREIFAVVEELSRFSNICLCITSRTTTVPPDCRLLAVPPLSADAALRVFSHIHDSDERPDLINNILEQLDFHPLSVTLLATVSHHKEWDNDQLSKEWHTHRAGLLRTDLSKGLAAAMEFSLASSTFRELGPEARNLLDVIAFFPQGIDENSLDWLFPTIFERENIFDKFCILSLTYRNNGFFTMLAPLRDYLCPKDPKSSPLLCTTKERYLVRMSVDLGPDRPVIEETQWITSEDVNVEHLLDVFTTIDANSGDVWDACCHFMGHLRWHKPRPVILEPKIYGLPDDHCSKPECLFELSRLFNSAGNPLGRKGLLNAALKLRRERGSDRQIAQTLIHLANSNRLIRLHSEGIQQAKEALEIFDRLGDTAEQAQCLIELAWLLHDDKRLDAAEEAGFRAMDLVPWDGNLFLVCQSRHLLGIIYQSKGEIEKAIHHFEAALGIASSFNWHDDLFWIHYELAALFLHGGRLDDAQAHIEYSKSHAANNVYHLGRAMALQAEVWYVHHRFVEAKSEVLHAADIYAKLGVVCDLEDCRKLLWEIEQNSMHEPAQLESSRSQ